MALEFLATLIFGLLVCGFASSAPVRVTFEKCGVKGFTCENSKEVPNRVDITFACVTNVTTQDVLIYLWQFNSPGTIYSLTIQNCNSVHLSFTCTGENKPIQWLKVSNVKNLNIVAPVITHNPPTVIFENISNIETLPRDTFVQIKKTAYRPGCFTPVNDLESIYFKNVHIGMIQTEAFKNLTNMKNFTWSNVSVSRFAFGAVQLEFVEEACGLVKNFNFGVLEPMAFQITGDGFSLIQGFVADMWATAVNGTIYDFEFQNSTVDNIQSGAIAILSQNVYITDNHFRSIESGSFHKISPGLLHDSQRNFGRLLFTYKFRNNIIDHVEDGGIRPDIEAYKNVAAEVSFTDNILQCSCESLTWMGADIDLGNGFSVLKDFNTLVLDPTNKNKCNFTPCMCFGVRSPYKRNNTLGNIF